MKKFLCAVLACLMLCLTFAACSEKPGDAPVGQDLPAAAEGQPAEDEQNDEPEVFAASVPEGTDLGGYGFRILVYDGTSSVWHDAASSPKKSRGTC